jgi:nucleoside-diphosphate-sugar epimerase
VVHLAFKHDIMFSGGHEEAGMTDRRAIETFGDTLAGSDRPFVIASGTGNLTPGRVLTEQDAAGSSDSAAGLRMGNAVRTVELAERGVRSVVLRLPPTVHGDGDAGFMATLVGTARAKGVSAYIGDGANRWPAVHRVDAAALFRLALEGAAPGSVLHAVADEGVSIRSMAEVIGRHLELPVTSVSAEAAGEHFGWLAGFLGLDVPASGAWTQESMGWQPTGPGLIEDLEKGHYFQS